MKSADTINLMIAIGLPPLDIDSFSRYRGQKGGHWVVFRYAEPPTTLADSNPDEVLEASSLLASLDEAAKFP